MTNPFDWRSRATPSIASDMQRHADHSERSRRGVELARESGRAAPIRGTRSPVGGKHLPKKFHIYSKAGSTAEESA